MPSIPRHSAVAVVHPRCQVRRPGAGCSDAPGVRAAVGDRSPCGAAVSGLGRRRLAVYRAWLVVSVALAVCVLLLWPATLFTYGGRHQPALVLPAVGALLGWWATFVAAWAAWTRLPRSSR